MSRIDFNLQKYDGEFKAAGMVRIKKAAEAIRDAAKAKCVVGTVTRPAKGKFWYWTERTPGAMKNTIRVSEKKGMNNVLVIAGNAKTWWATQMEYGRGAWKGGAKPFMRPAIHQSYDKIRSIIEGR